MDAKDCSLEDVRYELYVVEKIQRGLDRVDIEGGLNQQEVEERFSEWING